MDELKIRSYDAPPPKWNEFVEKHPQSKLYHLQEWNQMVQRTFGHPIKYFVLGNNGTVEGVLPLTDFKSILFGHIGVSLPFVNYGGPLMQDPDQNNHLFRHLTSIREKQNFKSIELRLDEAVETELPCRQHKVTFHLELPDDPDVLFKSFKAKLRSQIRRPLKENMYAKTGGMELLEDFYQVFTENMRDLGTPVLPKHFFESIFETFPERASIVTVYTSDHIPAAASFLINYKNCMEIPWASSVRKFNRFSPNMLLYWQSLQHAIALNCKVFDFGRCTPDTGTYRFKKQWGAIEKRLYWYYILPDQTEMPDVDPKNPKYDLFVKIWQKLPLPLARSVGPWIIKHIP